LFRPPVARRPLLGLVIVYTSFSMWSNLGAVAILVSLPVVLVFLVLQRALLDRSLVGAVGD
jgi:ABC-type glycerol-3-phosphate transport system permease component